VTPHLSEILLDALKSPFGSIHRLCPCIELVAASQAPDLEVGLRRATQPLAAPQVDLPIIEVRLRRRKVAIVEFGRDEGQREAVVSVPKLGPFVMGAGFYEDYRGLAWQRGEPVG
jgi:hypothetical protein